MNDLILIAKSKTDKMRVYFNEKNGKYKLMVNDVWNGDPIYTYDTRRGALIAMKRFEIGRHSGRPSTAW